MTITDKHLSDLATLLAQAPAGVRNDLLRLLHAAADPALASIARRAADAMRARDARRLATELGLLDEAMSSRPARPTT